MFGRLVSRFTSLSGSPIATTSTKVASRALRSFGKGEKGVIKGGKESQRHILTKPIPKENVDSAQALLSSVINPVRPLQERWKLVGKSLLRGGALVIGFHTVGDLINKQMGYDSLYLFMRQWTEKQQQAHGHLITNMDYPFIGIIGTFVAVFVAFRFRACHQFLGKHFLSAPASGKIYTWFTSAVSHAGGLHLLGNSIAFYTVGKFVYESMVPGDFLALCGSAVVGSGLAQLLQYAVVGLSKPSLGASGVIMAFLGYGAFLDPDAKYRIIFFPFMDFSGTEVVAMVAMIDIAGLLLGWSVFGHAAHLGGLVVGMSYYYITSKGGATPLSLSRLS
eukprot:m.24918 g.24918  ORF g.24918 m.24918 type:complete len:334 (+) comp5709_c0_seq2:71-1072(+)